MPNNLREVRKKVNCRMWDLATRSHVSASTLSAIERYGYEPRDVTKQKIADALCVRIADIWPTTSNSLETVTTP